MLKYKIRYVSKDQNNNQTQKEPTLLLVHTKSHPVEKLSPLVSASHKIRNQI
jgi:hypothetical protein